MSHLHKQKYSGTFRDAYEVYDALKRSSTHGISASMGKLFNNTFFGRDSALESLMLMEHSFDPQTATKVLFGLAELQGITKCRRSNEEPGRIHHELRDFDRWQGSLGARSVYRVLSWLWGGSAIRLRTYFAHDSTGLFLQLAQQCVNSEGSELLKRTVHRYDGSQVTLDRSVELAAEWIMSKQTDTGLVAVKRSNPLSLLFHTFQDSLTSFSHRSNSRLANTTKPLAFLEVQSISLDGLLAAAEMLPNHPRAGVWRAAASAIARATVEFMWLEQEGFFAAAVDQDKKGNWKVVRTIGINAGWVLDSNLLDLIPKEQRHRIVTGVIKKLFSSEFLTNVGLRSRALSNNDQPKHVITYHGNYTVWPSCTYMVSRGLRRQGFHRLAEQLDNRIMNGLRLDGKYAEFIVVLRDGRIVLDPREKRRPKASHQHKMDIQMLPEHNIGLSALSALAIEVRHKQSESPVISQLERSILADIPLVNDELDEEKLLKMIPQATDIVFSTKRGRVRTVAYVLHQAALGRV